ncbi:coiled-coil domain-containing protein 122-like [Thunnus albacares]|uniref:coiled-coil domain-containing protein 122-like n=1 Tax=Thunnus albacares TaxID=8236 RepID=UPI001CF6FEC3|nr:coiled-coil domain-containing protein 122-like [Thunnus albacares]XP_044200478.1 coiled-coil domain-containing protein 122-like [Thunnus albacares]XP_044200479.1 coiled-coil domain-containing protein 122-like [Thunnus albacares]XP_044200480.1 coiled-coil domain-containing protein 122-like [Thunnus albacares]XP_044200481.1 coiled-coil domain-containing protein 122-like [Thunnus albacares]
MSNFKASEDGTRQQCSLTKAVEDVSQRGYAQTEALKERQKTLSSLKVSLSDVEKKAEEAEQELRSKVRELLMLEGEVEHLELQRRVLHDRCASISADNTKLQIRISEEEEKACTALAGFNTYRNKMEGHRAAVLHAESQTEAHKELEEKRALVRMLTQTKEELKEDLENPNGNTVQMAKREINALKGEITVMRKSVAERREQLRKEFVTQSQIKKDIQIQNRRYEAIIKRLRCQLSKAQAVHRQMSGDIYHMERQIAKLKRQLESSQDSVVIIL